MLAKRIIPCLDIKDGQTVKGINFVNLQHAGDPLELAEAYVEQGADELVFLDITATLEGRSTFKTLVKDIARKINIPFTVGGGITSVEDVSSLLNVGADKVSINSAAVKNPDIIDSLAREFGSQCIVLAMDVKQEDDKWDVYVKSGSENTGLDALVWAKEAESRGVGEILLTSMDHDGTKSGFALEITSKIASSLGIPVIASGGAGNVQHFIDVFQDGQADAALAASIFHFSEILIPELKQNLDKSGIPVRL